MVCLDVMDAKCRSGRSARGLAFAQTPAHGEGTSAIAEYMDRAGFKDVRSDDLTHYVMAVPAKDS
jgi:hypothetical protein